MMTVTARSKTPRPRARPFLRLVVVAFRGTAVVLLIVSAVS